MEDGNTLVVVQDMLYNASGKLDEVKNQIEQLHRERNELEKASYIKVAALAWIVAENYFVADDLLREEIMKAVNELGREQRIKLFRFRTELSEELAKRIAATQE